MPDDLADFFAPPPFDPATARATLVRALRDLKLAERNGAFELNGQPVVKARVEGATLKLDGAPGKTFFGFLLQNTKEGYFSDPIYGGNRNKASWRMIGYPGLPATYREKIEAYRGKRYEQEPQSIADFS